MVKDIISIIQNSIYGDIEYQSSIENTTKWWRTLL